MIILVAACILFFWFSWKTYNTLVPRYAACRESLSNIDVIALKRGRLIDTIFQQTRQYSEYERGIIVQVSEDMRTNGNISFNRLRDAYPDLLYNERISEQLTRLAGLEDELQSEIACYNHRVRNLNEIIKRFPEIFFCRLFGWNELNYYMP